MVQDQQLYGQAGEKLDITYCCTVFAFQFRKIFKILLFPLISIGIVGLFCPTGWSGKLVIEGYKQ
jgi:hypothetical protein